MLKTEKMLLLFPIWEVPAETKASQAFVPGCNTRTLAVVFLKGKGLDKVLWNFYQNNSFHVCNEMD